MFSFSLFVFTFLEEFATREIIRFAQHLWLWWNTIILFPFGRNHERMINFFETELGFQLFYIKVLLLHDISRIIEGGLKVPEAFPKTWVSLRFNDVVVSAVDVQSSIVGSVSKISKIRRDRTHFPQIQTQFSNYA